MVGYLAGQSAGRCGPCFNGLPALAAASARSRSGTAGPPGWRSSRRLVVRRGACAHPDGTVRLVRSLLSTFAAEVEAHGEGRCLEAARLRVVPVDSPVVIAAEAAS